MYDKEWVERIKLMLKDKLTGGQSATLLDETYLTCTEGSSNKYHLFVLYKYDNNDGYIAGNCYGPIGKSSQGCVISSHPVRAVVEQEVNKKIKAKVAKGYKFDSLSKGTGSMLWMNALEAAKAYTTTPKVKKVAQVIPVANAPRRKFDLSI